MKRNWSDVPLMPVPLSVIVQVEPETVSAPAGDAPPISWQVQPEGQFGSGGGVTLPGMENACMTPLVSPTRISPFQSLADASIGALNEYENSRYPVCASSASM